MRSIENPILYDGKYYRTARELCSILGCKFDAFCQADYRGSKKYRGKFFKFLPNPEYIEALEKKEYVSYLKEHRGTGPLITFPVTHGLGVLQY